MSIRFIKCKGAYEIPSVHGSVSNTWNAADKDTNAPSISIVKPELDSLDRRVSIIESNKLNFPIGYVYISVNDTNPGQYCVGTWERFAKGKTLVGVDESDTSFDEVEKTGGEKTHTLTTNEMPSHYHNEYYTWSGASTVGGNWKTQMVNTTAGGVGQWTHNTGLSTDVSLTGGGQAHNNLQPYITTYMWIRVS